MNTTTAFAGRRLVVVSALYDIAMTTAFATIEVHDLQRISDGLSTLLRRRKPGPCPLLHVFDVP